MYPLSMFASRTNNLGLKLSRFISTTKMAQIKIGRANARCVEHENKNKKSINEVYSKYADVSSDVLTQLGRAHGRLTTMTTLVCTALLGVIGILMAYAYQSRIEMRETVKEMKAEMRETRAELKETVKGIERVVTDIVKNKKN